MTRILLAALAAAALMGPASAARSEGCIWADRIDGFSDAKREAITLSQGGRDYRAAFQGDCVGIEWAEDIAVVAHTQCLEAGDKISFHDAGSIPQHCLIKGLSRIEKPAKS